MYKFKFLVNLCLYIYMLLYNSSKIVKNITYILYLIKGSWYFVIILYDLTIVNVLSVSKRGNS